MSQQLGITVKSFDHVTIICADLEATRRFYVDLLGMTEVSRPAFKFPGLWFQTGNVQIHATQESPEAGKAGWAKTVGDCPNFAPGTIAAMVAEQNVPVPFSETVLKPLLVSRGHHIAFAVNDVSEALKIVELHGVRIASPLQQRPDGYKQAYLYDPDGHIVEIVSD